MKKKAIFLLVSVIIGLVALNIPITNIVGSNQRFSLFDFFAPTAGAFLTSFWGAISVIMVKLINILATDQPFDTTTIIRLFPLAVGAVYFGAKKYQKLTAVVPLICLILFILHPQGRAAWVFSLYWLIPLIAAFVRRSLVFNSLGATFTAHAVGSVAFLYAFNLPTEVWLGLIPIVFLERMLFTGGMAVSYVVMNSLVNWLSIKLTIPSLQKLVRPEYTFSRQLLAHL